MCCPEPNSSVCHNGKLLLFLIYISETSCRYDCWLDFLSLASWKASQKLKGMVSSVMENVKYSMNTRSGLEDDIETS